MSQQGNTKKLQTSCKPNVCSDNSCGNGVSILIPNKKLKNGFHKGLLEREKAAGDEQPDCNGCKNGESAVCAPKEKNLSLKVYKPTGKLQCQKLEKKDAKDSLPTYNELMIPYGVEDLKISMVTNISMESFDMVRETAEEDDIYNDSKNMTEKSSETEPKLFFAVPVPLTDDTLSDQWRLEDTVELSESKDQMTGTSSGSEKHYVNPNPMHLTFSTGGGGGQDLMLMTPQELERMPESGIEFEESVGPKEAQNSSEAMCEVESSSGDTEGELGTLATISISTDRDSDTTNIVINTKQGQQAYKINTTDLMQAAATMHPITLADLMDKSVEEGGEVIESSDLAACYSSQNLTTSKIKSLAVPECSIQEEKIGPICTHTGRCKKAFTCPECGKQFQRQCKLKVHLMMHAGSRPFKCTFEGCDWTFNTIYKLNRHLESHSNAKVFVCDIEGCDRQFTTIYNLNSHKKIHAQPNVVTCVIESCNRQFQTKRQMELHLREHEGVEAPYKCSVPGCGKTYYTTNSMASHLRVHQKNEFQCNFEGCNKIFDRLSRFKMHVWKHTGERPYVCTSPGCTWAFSSASKLKRHIRKHTGERQYTCKEPGCGKSFLRLEHLQGHAVTHSGDKPFWCTFPGCDAKFSARSSLYVHQKKHKMNEEKSVLVCPVETCKKTYNCKSSLRVHTQRYHSRMEDAPEHLGGITLIAADENESQTILPENLQSLVAITVPSNVDGSSLLEDAVDTNLTEAPDYLLAPIIEEGPVSNGNEIASDLIYSNDSANLTISAQSSSNSNEIAIPATKATEISNSMGLLSVLQTNNSGSARTDFCCNHLLANRSRKRTRLLQQNQQASDSQCEIKEEMTSSDVVLTSTVLPPPPPPPITNPSNILYLPNSLLADDPSHGELYQEEGLFSSMAKELAVPISLLTEQANGHSDFTSTTINLQDLE